MVEDQPNVANIQRAFLREFHAARIFKTNLPPDERTFFEKVVDWFRGENRSLIPKLPERTGDTVTFKRPSIYSASVDE